MGYGKVFFFEEAVAEKEENDLSIYADEVISVLAAGDREKVREFSDRVFNAFGKRQSREKMCIRDRLVSGKVAAVSYTESNPAMSFFGRLFK